MPDLGFSASSTTFPNSELVTTSGRRKSDSPALRRRVSSARSTSRSPSRQFLKEFLKSSSSNPTTTSTTTTNTISSSSFSEKREETKAKDKTRESLTSFKTESSLVIQSLEPDVKVLPLHSKPSSDLLLKQLQTQVVESLQLIHELQHNLNQLESDHHLFKDQLLRFELHLHQTHRLDLQLQSSCDQMVQCLENCIASFPLKT